MEFDDTTFNPLNPPQCSSRSLSNGGVSHKHSHSSSSPPPPPPPPLLSSHHSNLQHGEKLVCWKLMPNPNSSRERLFRVNGICEKCPRVCGTFSFFNHFLFLVQHSNGLRSTRPHAASIHEHGRGPGTCGLFGKRVLCRFWNTQKNLNAFVLDWRGLLRDSVTSRDRDHGAERQRGRELFASNLWTNADGADGGGRLLQSEHSKAFGVGDDGFSIEGGQRQFHSKISREYDYGQQSVLLLWSVRYHFCCCLMTRKSSFFFSL